MLIVIIAAFVVVVSCGFGEGGSKRPSSKGGKEILDDLAKTEGDGGHRVGNGTGGQSDESLARELQSEEDRKDAVFMAGVEAVSYTHLTLPTKRIV